MFVYRYNKTTNTMLIIAYIIILTLFFSIFSSGKFTIRHLIACLILVGLLVLCYFYNYEAAMLKQSQICHDIKLKCSDLSYNKNGILSIANEIKTCHEFTRDCHLPHWIYNIMDMFMFQVNL